MIVVSHLACKGILPEESYHCLKAEIILEIVTESLFLRLRRMWNVILASGSEIGIKTRFAEIPSVVKFDAKAGSVGFSAISIRAVLSSCMKNLECISSLLSGISYRYLCI